MAKQVTDRLGAIELVASSAETHRQRIQDAFAQDFSPYLRPGETLPNLGLVAELVARALRDRGQRLDQASQAHERELADDAKPREARDQAAERVNTQIVFIRQAVASIYGERFVRALGIEGKTASEPKAVREQGKLLLDQLRNPQLVWPQPLIEGIQVDKAPWIARIEAPLRDLDQALGDVARELRESQATGANKAAALEASDGQFSRGASFLSATFRLVGDDRLADRVRPSTRRPGQTEDEPEEPSGGAGGPAPATGGA